MAYNSSITVELLSMFRWKETGWKSPVSLISPDMTIKLGIHDSCLNNTWTVDVTVEDVEVDGELVDESVKERLVDAVARRCKNDLKVIQMFGRSLRNGYVQGLKRSNMFYPTDFLVNFGYRYRFIVAADGETVDSIKGFYLVPSYIPAPRNGYEDEAFYKMTCYERM